MNDAPDAHVPKWPFFLGDALLLALAVLLFLDAGHPLKPAEFVACGLCVLLGALLGILPFFLEYRLALKRIEAGALGTVSDKIQNLEKIAAQISLVTNHWNTAQDAADRTVNAAREISDRMAAEVREFSEFMQKMNDSEKAALRLEVEKLRRGESEWLQVLVRIMDHIYAIYSAAERSGQANVTNQLSNFQNACRDATRRIGLTPLLPARGEPFDPQRHQWADGETPPLEARITEVVATGYSFQGKPIRSALVRAEAQETAGKPAPSREAGQLPLAGS